MIKNLPKVISSKVFSIICLLIIVAIMVFAYYLQERFADYIGLGLIGLFIGCFLANVTVLLPAPGLLLVGQFSLLCGPFLAATVGSIGVALGEMAGYLVGYMGQNIVQIKKNLSLLGLFRKHPYRTIFLFSLLPLPFFDVIGMLSGFERIKWKQFLFACWLGKFLKMALIAFSVVYFSDFYPDFIQHLG